MKPSVDDIYEETRNFYSQMAPRLGPKFAHGFRILYGPPYLNPNALVIGFQPGGDRSHSKLEEHRGPSRTNEYLVQSWPLAREMRKRFGHTWLQGVVGTNAVFFRCPSTTLWRQIDANVRTSIEAFCRNQAIQLVDRMKPKMVLLLGWDALEGLAAGA